MAYPKIIYDAGAGNVTLTFTYPPVQKPGTDKLVASRTDSITSSGLKQSWNERTDTFRLLQMDFIPMADLVDWAAFMSYALTGGEFDYYPDADISSFETWSLEDTTWDPKYAFRGISKTSLTLRKVITDDSSS